MILVKWNKNGLMLQVLDVFEGRFGETRLLVCKQTAKPPHGVFSVRAADTSILDYMEA